MHQTPIDPSDVQNWKVVPAPPLVQALFWVHALILNGSEFHLVIAVIETTNIELQNHFEQWLVKGERVEEGGGGSARVRLRP